MVPQSVVIEIFELILGDIQSIQSPQDLAVQIPTHRITVKHYIMFLGVAGVLEARFSL